MGDLTILPTYFYIKSWTFVAGMILREGTFMSYNVFKLPNDVWILVSVDIVNNIVVSKYFLKLIIIDGATKTKKCGVILNTFLVFVDSFNNFCSKFLPILLRFK